jgi:hypothetical protein
LLQATLHLAAILLLDALFRGKDSCRVSTDPTHFEGDEAGRKYSPWPEPRGHSAIENGPGHLERTEYASAEEFFLRAWGLLEIDDVSRLRWYIPLLHARGALALARGRYDEAGQFATESLELARKTSSRSLEVVGPLY